MWHEPVQPFLEGGVTLLPLAVLCQMPERKSLDKSLRDVVREIDRRLAAEPNYAEAVRLMTAAYRLTFLRLPKERVESIFEGASIMHETVAWDEAEDAGYLKSNIETLFELGHQLFGDLDPKTEASLKRIKDIDRTKRMRASILKVKSWKALLGVK
jgi:hypothetical protein